MIAINALNSVIIFMKYVEFFFFMILHQEELLDLLFKIDNSNFIMLFRSYGLG